MSEIKEIGEGVNPDFELAVGEIIIPVVSTSALPLHLDEVGQVSAYLVEVSGHAILFDGIGYSGLPEDFSLPLAMSASVSKHGRWPVHPHHWCRQV